MLVLLAEEAVPHPQLRRVLFAGSSCTALRGSTPADECMAAGEDIDADVARASGLGCAAGNESAGGGDWAVESELCPADAWAAAVSARTPLALAGPPARSAAVWTRGKRNGGADEDSVRLGAALS